MSFASARSHNPTSHPLLNVKIFTKWACEIDTILQSFGEPTVDWGTTQSGGILDCRNLSFQSVIFFSVEEIKIAYMRSQGFHPVFGCRISLTTRHAFLKSQSIIANSLIANARLANVNSPGRAAWNSDFLATVMYR